MDTDTFEAFWETRQRGLPVENPKDLARAIWEHCALAAHDAAPEGEPMTMAQREVAAEDALNRDLQKLKADHQMIVVHNRRVPKGARLTEAYEYNGQWVILGGVDSDDETHNCDEMGCSSVSHVVARFPKSQPSGGDEVARLKGEVERLRAELAPLRELVGVDARAAAAVSDINHWTRMMDKADEADTLRARVTELEAEREPCVAQERGSRTYCECRVCRSFVTLNNERNELASELAKLRAQLAGWGVAVQAAIDAAQGEDTKTQQSEASADLNPSGIRVHSP